MKHNTLVFAALVSTGLAVLAAIAGAVYLADQGKDGWGWLIFLAICIGSYRIKDNEA